LERDDDLYSHFVPYKLVMPITKSAKKAMRQSLTRKAINDRRRRAMKSTAKDIEKMTKDGKFDDSKLSIAYKAIDKAAKKGIIKKNTAARKKSRLARMVVKK